MSIVIDILENLMKLEFRYKGARLPWIDKPRFKEYSEASYRTSLSRLHKKGYILRDEKGWKLTSVGKSYLQKYQNGLRNFDFQIRKDAPKNLIVMFDIPEKQNKERKWFRLHLKKLGYIMIQKSVWVGPAPLPKEFKDYTKTIGLDDTIKTFKLAKGYIVNK